MSSDYNRYSGYGMPSVDFSPLGELGNVYNKAKNERTLQDLGPLVSSGNLAGAAAIAAQAGRPDLALQFSNAVESRNQHGASNARADEQLALQRQQADPEYLARKEEALLKMRQQYEPPMALGPGQALVNRRTGETVREAQGGMVDADTLNQMAEQYLAGDTSVFTNLGRGAQGAENVTALRKAIAGMAKERGVGGADVAQTNAEYFGQKAGQRTLGTRTANMELAVNEAQKLAPLVIETSNAVDRTKYPKVNDIIMAFEKGTGDENIVKYGAALNSFINVYARAISPTGVSSVSDKEHARELIQQGYSKGQVGAAIGQMMKEMAAARAAPSAVKQQMREQATGRAAPETAPEGGAPAAPKAGEVRDGYRFRGGDPAKPESWIKM